MPSIRAIVNTATFFFRHPATRRAPIQTVSNVIRWQRQVRSMKGTSEHDWVNGSSLIAGRGHSGVSGNIYYGLHEWEDMAFFGHFLRKDDLFVDAGANFGSYSVLASAVAGASVHAVEAAKESVLHLKENFLRNSIQGKIHAVALGDKDGEAWFSANKDCVNALTREGQGQQVRMVRLDSLGLSPIAMKADLEGAEELMLEGAKNTLGSLWAIEIETVSEKSRDRLQAAGFVRRTYNPDSRKLLPRDAAGPAKSSVGNQLWIKKEREREIAERVRTGPTIVYGSLRL